MGKRSSRGGTLHPGVEAVQAPERPLLTLRVSRDSGRTFGREQRFFARDCEPPLLNGTYPRCGQPRRRRCGGRRQHGARAAGPAGPPGPAGADGKDGTDGQRGPAGPPPSGWTFVHDGTTYTCTPAADGSTHYTCAADEPPRGQPGERARPLAAALDPHRRQYA
jgi:hypothetical protein